MQKKIKKIEKFLFIINQSLIKIFFKDFRKKCFFGLKSLLRFEKICGYTVVEDVKYYFLGVLWKM